MELIRLAEEFDVGAIASFDHVAQCDHKRVAFIQRSIANRDCYIAIADNMIVGYAVLDYSFYENGFISMLYVHPEHRRRGVGEELIKYLEGVCRTTKLFTSANLSNTAMQPLLAKLGYEQSGVIHNLDENDPELVYFKLLKQKAV